jgi:glycosyltransferase involved in cell wall biosynthesis
MNDVQVIVGIPSYRNPAGLKKLLRELSLKEADLISRVVVVDNDAGEAATAAVRELRNDIPNLEVSVHLELQPGISNARNRIVAEALKHPFEFLAMLDDDEYPAGGWLRALLDRAEETGADVISGPVRPVFECDPLEPILPDDYAKSGGRVTRSGVFIDSTANIMFSRRVLEAFEGAWFDLDFGMSLGHDAELLHRMQRAGFRQAIALRHSYSKTYPRIAFRKAGG